MNNLLENICQHAKSVPQNEAIVTATNVLSYQQLQDSIDELTHQLMKLNVQRLALWGSNSIDWILIDLAAQNANITIIPIPLFFTSTQVEHLLQDSQVQLLCILKQSTPTWLNQLVKQLNDGYITELKKISAKCFYLQPKTAPFLQSDACKITYTSGSTGQPKGVCLANSTIESIIQTLSHALQDSHLQRHLCLIPFATLLENVAGVYAALNMGRSVLVGEVQQFGLISNHDFDVQRFAETVAIYQIESVILLPHMLKAIVEYCIQNPNHLLQSLKFIAVGGGKVSPYLLQQCQELHLPVYEGYGLSECASVVCLNLPHARKIGSVGRVLPHVEVSIDQNNEIRVKGNAMLGYVNQPQITDYIYTGDAGYFDEDGYLYITGRIKQMLISSFGRNISPEWVESNSLTETEIQQIAVFGEAQPCLSAVIYAQENISNQQIEAAISRANTRMPDYAQIKHWCRTKQAFTLNNQMLTDNGKLRRKHILQHFQSVLFQNSNSKEMIQ